jgi:hypothetical protein
LTRARWIRVAGVALAGLATTAPAAGAAKKPDLVVAAVSGVPPTLERGEDVRLSVTTQNRGKKKAGRSTTRLILSTDQRPSSGDLKPGSEASVKPLAPKARAVSRITLTGPGAASLGSYYVIACADDAKRVAESSERNNCRAAAPAFRLRALSSEELIEEAVSEGEITAEQGVQYKLFAQFGDDRLPERFEGAPDPFGHGAMEDAIQAWDGLSVAAKDVVRPFLIPPYHEGSYWDDPATPTAAARSAPRRRDNPDSPWCTGNVDVALEDWSFVEADSGPAAGKIRIWYQDDLAATDAALANSLMTTMETKIWPPLTTLMGREPLPDSGSTESCEGGSDALDIALLDLPTASTFSHTSAQENTPARMMFPRSPVPPGWAALEPYLAHEFMHMIQFSYTFGSGDATSTENRWIREGTAQWVQDYVTDPAYGIGITPEDTEHQPLPTFFNNPQVPLDSATPKPHDYASYIFPFWAVRSSNSAAIVKQMWDGIGTQKSLPAAKAAFGGNWNTAWKDFVRTNWNQGSINQLQSWDLITNTPAVAGGGTVPLGAPVSFTAQVDHAAAKYLTFYPGPSVDRMRLRNLGTTDPEHGVQAIIRKKNGSLEVRDLTSTQTEVFEVCNVDDITLVLSNASVLEADTAAFSMRWDTAAVGGGFPPTSSARRGGDTCAPEPLTGTFSGDADFTNSGLHLTFDWSGSMEFVPFGPFQGYPPDPSEIWQRNRAVEGSVTISGSGDATNGCTLDFPEQTVSYDSRDLFSPNDGFHYLDVAPGTPSPATPVRYAIFLEYPGNPGTIAGTQTCPPPGSSGPVNFPISGLKLVYTENPQTTTVPATYAGSATFATQGASYTWSFTDPSG